MTSLHATPPAGDDIELIFLGTGTSSSLPHVDCLTAPPGTKPCRTCLSTLQPEGKKNIRRNTSVAIRMRAKDGNKVTIVIDVGKSFQVSAVEWFPKYGLRRIDAVLITHAHADAMNGLDDLRGWTLNGAIQPHVDLYVSQGTFLEIQRAFPYLVSKYFASGGGDVPEFKWHIIEDRVPFEIEDTGIKITPFSVHHGRLFGTAPPLQSVPTPNLMTPVSVTPVVPGSPMHPTMSIQPSELTKKIVPGSPTHPTMSIQPSELTKKHYPYFCLGFIINNAITYLSDVSHIPEEIWAMFHPEDSPSAVPPVFVLDCLRLQPHTSHLGIADSIANARRMGAPRTYLTGFGHEVSHDEYVTIAEALGGEPKKNESSLTPSERTALELIPEGNPLWVRPAFDGLRVWVSEDMKARDDEYD